MSIPYFELRSVHVAGVRLPVFGAMLTAGIAVGHAVMLRRARAAGLGPPRVVDLLGIVAVGSAVVAAWCASALVDGARGVSSAELGSLPALAGALVGGLAFVRIKRLDGRRYLDLAAYAFPFGWLFVRGGCALVHDHLGRASDSALAVRFPDGARFDLGLLELLGVPLILALAVLLARRRTRAGILSAAVLASYGALRLAIEPLRTDEGTSASLAWLPWLGATLGGAALVALRSRPAGEPRRRDAD